LSRIERNYFAVSILAGLVALVVGLRLEGSRWWDTHPFVLELWASLTAFLVGLPVAISIVGRVNGRVARAAAAQEAIYVLWLAMIDVYAQANNLANNNPDEAGGLYWEDGLLPVIERAKRRAAALDEVMDGRPLSLVDLVEAGAGPVWETSRGFGGGFFRVPTRARLEWALESLDDVQVGFNYVDEAQRFLDFMDRIRARPSSSRSQRSTGLTGPNARRTSSKHYGPCMTSSRRSLRTSSGLNSRSRSHA
jgi:hypothetical protein